jgi:hypothetical protein
MAIPYDATRLRFGAVEYNGSGANGGAPWDASRAGFNNALKFSASIRVPIVGWSGTTAVQPGSRYLWAQRFAATATRVTTTPSKPGEYRARRIGTDTAPTTGPTAGDGFRIDAGSGIAAGRINQYDVYVGPGKVVQCSGYQNTGRTGHLVTDFWVTSAGVAYGMGISYDPATGVVSVFSSTGGASNGVGTSADMSTGISTGYFDLLVADDPVPVAIAPSVHVEATSDAGQVLTAVVTDVQYEDEIVDTHGAWSGSVFTAPVAGVYAVSATFTPNSATSVTPQVYRNGVFYMEGIYSHAASGSSCLVSTAMSLSAGGTIRVRSGNGCTRGTSAAGNWIAITRIGD